MSNEQINTSPQVFTVTPYTDSNTIEDDGLIRLKEPYKTLYTVFFGKVSNESIYTKRISTNFIIEFRIENSDLLDGLNGFIWDFHSWC